MTECKPYCDVSKVTAPRRAVLLCAACQRDVSLEHLMWYEASEHGKYQKRQPQTKVKTK